MHFSLFVQFDQLLRHTERFSSHPVERMKDAKEKHDCTLDHIPSYLSLYPHKSNSGQWYSEILMLQGFTEWLRITQAWGSAQRFCVLIRPWHWQWVLLGALWRGSCRNVVLNNSRQTIVCKWSRKQMVLSIQKKTHQNTEQSINNAKWWCIMIRDGNCTDYKSGSLTVQLLLEWNKYLKKELKFHNFNNKYI